MGVTATTRHSLSKQAFKDVNWHTALNSTLDTIDAALPWSYAGNPNGNVAGDYVGQPVWDSANQIAYFCQTTGDAATATWSGIIVSSSFYTFSGATGPHSYTLPDADAVIVTTTAAQSLTNKTLDTTTTLGIFDSLLTIKDNASPTKMFQFQASGITAGQTRILTVPDKDGTLAMLSDIGGGGFTAATQAEMEAGTSLTAGTTPGRQQFHPSAAKFWVMCSGSGTTINASYNVTSITHSSTGVSTVNIATDMSSASYCVIATIEGGTPNIPSNNTNGSAAICLVSSKAAGSVTISTFGFSDLATLQWTVANPTSLNVVGYGDQ